VLYLEHRLTFYPGVMCPCSGRSTLGSSITSLLALYRTHVRLMVFHDDISIRTQSSL
jgi:hypothetical protein